jgi:hypothetical protein
MGHRTLTKEGRLRAVQALRQTDVRAIIASNLSDAHAAVRAERDENVCRKDFTALEAVHYGRLLERFERPAAKKRMKRRTFCCGNLPQQSDGKVREIVASAVGLDDGAQSPQRPAAEACGCIGPGGAVGRVGAEQPRGCKGEISRCCPNTCGPAAGAIGPAGGRRRRKGPALSRRGPGRKTPVSAGQFKTADSILMSPAGGCGAGGSYPTGPAASRRPSKPGMEAGRGV